MLAVPYLSHKLNLIAPPLSRLYKLADKRNGFPHHSSWYFRQNFYTLLYPTYLPATHIIFCSHFESLYQSITRNLVNAHITPIMASVVAAAVVLIIFGIKKQTKKMRDRHEDILEVKIHEPLDATQNTSKDSIQSSRIRKIISKLRLEGTNKPKTSGGYELAMSDGYQQERGVPACTLKNNKIHL